MSTASFAPLAPALVRVPQPKRWSVAEFHAICGEPAFENKRMILVEGEILDIPAANPPHDIALGLTDEALREAFGAGYWVRGQMALMLGLSTDPVPDLAVVRGGPRDFRETPRSALLIVEIAESSLAFDTRDKANLYAAGGIPEYWVVDLVHRQLHVYRDPAPDAAHLFGAHYRSRQSFDATACASSLAAPHGAIAVSRLLP